MLCLLNNHAIVSAQVFNSVADRLLDNDGGSIASSVGDLNNDGLDEFITSATSSSNDPHLRVHQYVASTGQYVSYDILSSAVVNSRQDRFAGDIAIADINADGYLDIVIPESENSAGSGSVSWFENPDGDLAGVWQEFVIAQWSGDSGDEVAHMSEIEVGDLDGDGMLDVVTRDVARGLFLIQQEADGSGWLDPRFISVNPREGLIFADIDQDLDLDIVINGVWLETPDDIQEDDFTIHTYASAWYPSSAISVAINDYACQVATADFNLDGYIDIAISNSEELSNASTTASKPDGVRVYLSDGASLPNWTEMTLISTDFSWHSLEIGDVDSDGDIDIVTGISQVGADNADPKVVLLVNNYPSVSFSEVIIDEGFDGDPTSPEAAYIYNASLGDVDGDGDLDLLSPQNWNSGAVRIYENQTDPVTVLNSFQEWFTSYGLSENTPSDDDSDMDGHEAITEFALGMDPTIVDDSPIEHFFSSDGLGYNFSYPVVRSDINYEVFYSIDLVTWLPSEINEESFVLGDTVTATETASVRGFFRLNIVYAAP